MSADKLEVGDTVRIRSGGGPLMTILDIDEDNGRLKVRYDKTVRGDVETVDEWLPIRTVVFDDGMPPFGIRA